MDTSADSEHCGGCDESCPVSDNGESQCFDGVCQMDCDEGWEVCGLECADLESDARHCGGCGHECEEGQGCSEGMCRQTCEFGSSCVDPPEYGSFSCQDGFCVINCEDGRTLCGGECVDTEFDNRHCGGCDSHCEVVNCIDGACSECDPDDEPFGNGDREPGEPVWICSVDHLENLRDGDEGFGIIEVHADLDMGGEAFAPLGLADSGGWERFDGKGAVISNINIVSSLTGVGFFRRVAAGAEVSNLRLEQVVIDAEGVGYVGAVAGTVHEGGQVREISVTGPTIEAADNFVGGLVGENSGTLEDVTVSGLDILSDSGESHQFVGGIAGANRGDIRRASASGSMGAFGEPILGRAGGLVGGNLEGGEIAESGAAVGIFSSGDEVGGLVGRNLGVITKSFASGEVVGGEEVGGLIGGIPSSGEISGIFNSYATGAVTGDDKSGGLVGAVQSQTEIINTYAAGNVYHAAEGEYGGFAGVIESDVAVQSCYWDVDTSNTARAIGDDTDGDVPGSEIQGYETSQFEAEEPALFDSWDFGGETGIWTFGQAPDGRTRPILRWQLE